jgi:hypothetical protein
MLRPPLRRKSRLGWGNRNLVTEPAKSFQVIGDGALDGFGVSGFAELDESGVLMQDVPHDFAQPVSDSPDGLHISKSDDKAFENEL